MVYLFPPDHWNAKKKVLIFSMGPWSQSFYTACRPYRLYVEHMLYLDP